MVYQMPWIPDSTYAGSTQMILGLKKILIDWNSFSRKGIFFDLLICALLAIQSWVWRISYLLFNQQIFDRKELELVLSVQKQQQANARQSAYK